MSESKARLKVLAGGRGDALRGAAAVEAPQEGQEGQEAQEGQGAQEGPREAVRGPLGAEAAVLVAEHLGVADALARRYRVPGHDPEDLRQVARLGLVMAAQRYREGSGHGFVPFAVPTITGTIKRHLRDQSWVVRPPRSVQELRLGVRAARERLEQDLGREPTTAELSEATGAAAGKVAEARGADSAMVGVAIEPLDGVSEPEAGGASSCVVSFTDPGFERVEERQMLAAALEGASEEDMRLIRMRFVQEMSQSEIAAELGVSQMQVSRLLRRLLDRMRRKIAA
ncbi:sigma-70 family RNA polymerase sigma factor [Sinomonas sp. B1-1]|uniref:sigma-70 family RNA polymerase sigma factor n=1 Tax=Sinomonas sp. B1-1 TaxID=3141454 RepID=UPI003D2673FA